MITVLHMRRIDTLTQMALRARMERGETSEATLEMTLRERTRRPSLGWTAEQIEALADDPGRRRLYFRRLGLLQQSAARLLYAAGGYEAVAEIADADLTAAYALTSFHPDAPDWTQRADARVRVLAAAQPFDSGIGDLFRDEATGEVHLCLADGFVSLGRLDLAEAA